MPYKFRALIGARTGGRANVRSLSEHGFVRRRKELVVNTFEGDRFRLPIGRQADLRHGEAR